MKNIRFKSAIRDHVVHDDHSIDWEQTRMKNKESIRLNRVIKELINIMKEASSFPGAG